MNIYIYIYLNIVSWKSLRLQSQRQPFLKITEWNLLHLIALRTAKSNAQNKTTAVSIAIRSRNKLKDTWAAADPQGSRSDALGALPRRAASSLHSKALLAGTWVKITAFIRTAPRTLAILWSRHIWTGRNQENLEVLGHFSMCFICFYSSFLPISAPLPNQPGGGIPESTPACSSQAAFEMLFSIIDKSHCLGLLPGKHRRRETLCQNGSGPLSVTANGSKKKNPSFINLNPRIMNHVMRYAGVTFLGIFDCPTSMARDDHLTFLVILSGHLAHQCPP